MQLHKFWGQNRRAALSSEFSGHNLPESGGPWLYERTVDLPEHDERHPERVAEGPA